MDYLKQIQEICDLNDIRMVRHSGKNSRAWRNYKGHGPKISVARVRTLWTYAVAMHELGHILGPHQDEEILAREAGAWIWAKENCMRWTPCMEKGMIRCLATYTRTYGNPEEGHILRSLVQCGPCDARTMENEQSVEGDATLKKISHYVV